MKRRKRLLINWVYWPAIGHAIEAYRSADAYRQVNPELEIGVMINAKTGVELHECLPQIDHFFPIDVSAFDSDPNGHGPFADIGPDWDYVFTDPRHENPMGSEALDNCEKAFRSFINPGTVNTGWGFGDALGGRKRPLALQIPRRAKRFAREFVHPDASVRICMLLGSGTEACRTPPMSFWQHLCQALVETFGNVEIILLGALQGSGTRTEGVVSSDIRQLMADVPQVRDGFDKGLLNQLALAETCDLHVSPHTGMSFAIQSVGVPWLALSGGWCAEQLFNGVPFYSVFPDCGQYPCDENPEALSHKIRAECKERKATCRPFLCLADEALASKLPEVLDAARRLVNRDQTYQECIDQHYTKLLPRGPWQPGDWFFDASQDSDFMFKRLENSTSSNSMQATPNGAPDG